MAHSPITDQMLFDAMLSRAAGEAYGAMATLPLICLGQVEGVDARASVVEAFDTWAAHLRVARDVVRTLGLGPTALRDAKNSLDGLLSQFANIRDAFIELAGLNQHPNRLHVHAKLVEGYAGLHRGLKDVHDATGIEISFLSARHDLRRATHARNLAWLATELDERRSTETGHPRAAYPASV